MNRTTLGRAVAASAIVFDTAGISSRPGLSSKGNIYIAQTAAGFQKRTFKGLSTSR